MSFDLKINDFCPHSQSEEIHITESDGRRVILNDIMSSTSPESLRVKVNGVEWRRDNVLEGSVVFDITDTLTQNLPGFQFVLPEIPALQGDQQGRFASSDQHVVLRACARERIALEFLEGRPRTFQIGQNLTAAPLYVSRETAHAWGLVRPALSRAISVSPDQDTILARFDANPNIVPLALLERPEKKPELERILVIGGVDGWTKIEILQRYELGPSIGATELLDGFTVPAEVSDAVHELLGDGCETLFDVSEEVRTEVEIVLGEARTQLNRILLDGGLDPTQQNDIIDRFDADPAIGTDDLLAGQDVSAEVRRRVQALLGDGRQPGTFWVEIPITKRLPLLGRHDFIEGEANPDDVLAFVNCERVPVVEVDGFTGTVTLLDAPFPCDLVEFEFCWKVHLLFVNGESGIVAVDPHHLSGIVRADIRYFSKIMDGWDLSPTEGSIGGQLDVVFDTTKRTNKGRVILEDLRRFANGVNTVFQTANGSLLPFDADFFNQSTDTLLNSAPISINGEVLVPRAFDPVLGLLQLDVAPSSGSDVRISYFFQIPDVEPDIIEVDYVTARTNCHRCFAMGRLDDVNFNRVSGDLVLVRQEQKLRQDLYKITGTIVGTNPFHRYYGTNFIIYIGQAGPAAFFQAQLTNEMLTAIGALQRLQNDQFSYQAEFIDSRELINAIQSVNVRQVFEIDPSIWQVDVLLQSDAANVVEMAALLTEEGVTLLDRATPTAQFEQLRNLSQ